MPYLQLRITLDPSGTRTAHRVRLLLRKFIRVWIKEHDDEPQTSAGFEELNKFGEPCDPHYHLNAYFHVCDLKDPLRSAKEWLRREARSLEFTLKGNKVWSCTLVEEPKDFLRWFRYPLKESPVPELICSFPTSSTLQELSLLAREERKRSIEINIIKREKAIDKQSFRDKLFKYLDEKNEESYHADGPEFTHKTIWILILNYYTEQGKAVCFKTITGYTVSYMLYLGLMTPDEAYEMRSNPQ